MKAHQAAIQLSENSQLNYLLHLPPQVEEDPDRLWPTILFLHGWGESGEDVEALFDHGLPAYVAANPDFPFIVIAPQCPWNTWWPELAKHIDQLLIQSLATYPIDPQRLYLTGLSMGGYGSWYLGTLWPQRFAAVAPICGGGYWFHGFPERVTAMKKTPVWAFHGAKDDVVPLGSSAQLVSTLRDSNGNVKFTIYPEADHDSWTETYHNPELYEWFLQHVNGQSQH